MTLQIIPTVFANTKEEFAERYARLVELFPALQIDFMDGKLVPATGISLDDVPQLPENVVWEAHLMVAAPGEWLAGVKTKGFSKMIIHQEAFQDNSEIHSLIDAIVNEGMEPILIQNPRTPVERLFPFAEKVGKLMFMGHEPGVEKIPFEDRVIEKIRVLRTKYPDKDIQVDGGVNDKSIGKAAAAGANIFNIGSFVFNSEDPVKAVALLRKLAEEK